MAVAIPDVGLKCTKPEVKEGLLSKSEVKNNKTGESRNRLHGRTDLLICLFVCFYPK